MKNILSIVAAIILVSGLGSCVKDSEFLDVQPTAFLTNDQVFSDPALVTSVLADLYNRQVDFSGLDNGWGSFADFSESFPSDAGALFFVQRTGWGYGEWGLDWNGSYTYIREINLFLGRDSASSLEENLKKRFYAEGRFLRANFYFEMVKRYGGVPLVTQLLEYDYKGDPTYLQVPRAKESAVYDFIISEAEAIKNDLIDQGGALLPISVKSRATKGAALAMEARAALYAASIAKYGSLRTPTVSLAGGEVGIDAGRANEYYTIALRAAKEIIDGSAGGYALYNADADLSKNFADLFLNKGSPETIYNEDFAIGGKTHGFTISNQPFSQTGEPGDAGRINPSLNLAEAFEKLDNTYAPFETSGYYPNQMDIFADRDARLAGTMFLPGSVFRNPLNISAGTLNADGTTTSEGVGLDGPVNGLSLRTQTGFYIRKYIDPAVAAGRRGTGSDVAFIRFRFAEVLLNAAEAAFELGDKATAAMYMNQVRARAGLTIPLTESEITFDRIVHERRVELAFEGHYFYDMKRWRLAHIVWDGTPTTLSDLKSNIGSATKRSTQPWGLWPYIYNNPSGPNDGEWVYREVLPPLVTGVNRFLLGNYYTQISEGTIGANPKIVRQPNQ